MIILQELANNISGLYSIDSSFLKFISRFLVDILAVLILVRFIYYKHYHRNDLFLTFFGFNIIIFLLTYLLNKVEMSMGAAFGLFAVFSMLRYRTENISAKDMTYLFIVIALGLITAISDGSWVSLAVLCTILLLVTALLEGGWLMRKENSKIIVYDRIELITPDKRVELLDDLEFRIGLKVHRVQIQEIDFLKDSTQMIIFYYEN